MGAPQFTSCVQPEDYKSPDFPSGSFFQSLGGVIAGGGLDLLLKLCDYMLHGKLVCLGGDQCAIGRVAGFETVDDKSGFDKIDNDFSINLMLCPNELSDFGSDLLTNYNIALAGPQGFLIKEVPGMPIPLESDPTQKPTIRYLPYSVSIDPVAGFGSPVAFGNAPEPDILVPVVHCEIEGNRTIVVCTAFGSFWQPISDAVCSFAPLGIPIGALICDILSLLLSPVISAILATSWLAGSGDNRDFDNAGSLSKGDTVVIMGRWVYDASHQGWNELHAVKSVQKLGLDSCGSMNLSSLRTQWCDQMAVVPPIRDPGKRPTGMTNAQGAVFDAQVSPEHRWFFHPLLDSCDPQSPPPRLPQ